MLVRVEEDAFGWLHARPVSVKIEERLRRERGDYDTSDRKRRAAVLRDAFIFVQEEQRQDEFLGSLSPARRRDLRQWGIAVRMDEETVRAFAGMET